jgi:1-acyl-sn-glycerol-3-phosphate acyltransferase
MIKFLCSQFFSANGWKFENKLPSDVNAFVMIGAPHTSNWDFVPAMTVAHRVGGKACFVIKQEWLKFPVGLFLKPMGALGVDRSKIKSGAVTSTTDLMANLFKQHKNLILMISPEGTRSPNDEWKSGFWHMAKKAQVPIALAYADYAKKKAGIGRVIYPSDFENDMRQIMNFYRHITPADPAKFKLDKRFL